MTAGGMTAGGTTVGGAAAGRSADGATADGSTGRRSLKVLIVSAYAAPHVGGVEIVVAQQARTLAALGHRVTVLTSRCGGGRPREQAAGYTVIRLAAWNGLEKLSGVPVPVWSPAVVWRLARLVGRADVVHVHDVYHGSSVLAAVWARLRHRPLFVTQHVGVVEHSLAAVSVAQRAVYRLLGRPLWGWAVSVTAYNPIVGAFLREHGVPARKVLLTSNGIDVSDFRPGLPAAVPAIRARHGLAPGVPVVLFAGRLVPKKGVQQLLGASDPDYQVVIAGPGQVPGHVPAGVTFLGPVSRAALRELYQASDIFACPAAGEMLTLVMQEAMACGLPVVTTADDAYAGYGFDPRGVALVRPEPEVLRAEFTSILGDPGRQAYMREYSRRVAEERFDWGKNSADLAADYQDACAVARDRRRPRTPPSKRPKIPPPPRRWSHHPRPHLQPRRSEVPNPSAARVFVAGALKTRTAKGSPAWWRPRYGMTALAAAALVVSLLLPAGRHQWALSLFRQSTRYTALSFTHPADLPSLAGPGQPVPVSFTVSNHEGRAAHYRYVLRTGRVGGAGSAGGEGRAGRAGGTGRGRVLDQASRTVAAGTSWTVSVVIRPACGAPHCRVEVSLPGYREAIAFLVSERGRRARRA